jgi:hypothetical protein
MLLRPVPKYVGMNQALKQISLPMHVFAEILLRGNPEPTLAILRQCNVIFGLEIGEVLKAVSGLNEEQIRTFLPFVSLGTPHYYRELYSGFVNLTKKHLDWAKLVKSNGLNFCGNMNETVLRTRPLRNRLDKITTIEPLVGNNDAFENFLRGCVSAKGTRPCKVDDPTRLRAAVMNNPYLGRFWRSFMFYSVSWSRLWKNQELNCDPTADRDDFADLMLPLYAANGDIVLTADNMLKKAIATIEVRGDVTTGLAKDF